MKDTSNNLLMVTDRRSGSALVIVILLSIILLLAGMSLTWMTGNAAFTSRKIEQGVRALSIAEAGIADMLAKMTTNYVYWQDNSFSANYADGTFTVTTATDTNTGHVLVTSVGVIEGETRTTVLELLGDLWTLYDSVLGVDGCIVAGGNITLDSSAITIKGSIHANGSVINAQGNPDVWGGISAAGTITGITSTGTVTEGAAPVVVPTYLPFDEWYILATNNGIYIGGDTNVSDDLVPANGVVYCNGNITFGNSSSVVGTIVASGNITIGNRFAQQTAFNTNWPSLLAGVNLIINNNTTFDGVMFAGNDADINNHSTMIGAIIALNNVTVKNRLTLTPLPTPPDWSPADTNDNPPVVIVGGWLQ